MTRTMLPNWIIAGAPKAGTSALFRWLTDHPDVSGSADKETYYFVDPSTHMFRADRNFRLFGLGGYARLFEGGDPSAAVVLEATPGYLYSETALRYLTTIPTRPSFIFLLREPVAQLRSLHRYFQQNWTWIPRDMSFREFIAAVQRKSTDFRGNELAANALNNAWYPDHLRRWRQVIGADRMVVLLYEDLLHDNRGFMRRVSKRLGIDPEFYDGYHFPRENSTYAVRSGWLQDLNVRVRSRLPKGRLYNRLRNLYRAVNTRPSPSHPQDPELERGLAEYFAPMLSQLEQEFGMDLTPWRGTSAPHPGVNIPSSGSNARSIDDPALCPWQKSA